MELFYIGTQGNSLEVLVARLTSCLQLHNRRPEHRSYGGMRITVDWVLPKAVAPLDGGLQRSTQAETSQRTFNKSLNVARPALISCPPNQKAIA